MILPAPSKPSGVSGFVSTQSAWNNIRSNNIEAPEGGVVLPLRYTVLEQPTYAIVSANSMWQDPARVADAELLREDDESYGRQCLHFPQVLRDARRIEEYYPGLSPNSPECMDKLGVSLAHCESKCENFYDSVEVERVFYPEMEKLLLSFFPDSTDALVYNHDVFDKNYQGDRTEDQNNKNPGVNAEYVNLVHNDLNDNSGRVRCRELLTKNLLNFGREQHYTGAEADAKMSRRFMSINLAKPMETVRQYPFVLCAWPSFADQPLHHRLSHLRRSCRRDHSLHPPPRSRVVLGFPSRRPPRSRCSSVTTLSPTVPCRAGLSTLPASTQPPPRTLPVAGTSWSELTSSSKETRGCSQCSANRSDFGNS